MKRIFAAAILMLTALHLFAYTEGRTDYAFVRSAEASSTFSEWLSGRKIIYDALNAFDDKLDTVWVEDKSHSGIGEKLTVVFYEPIKIDEIRITKTYTKRITA